MVWNTVHDEMLCKKILVVDPFTGTKKGTVERGTQWEEVAENLNKIHQVYFKVDKWAVRDRYNLLSKELRNKLEREEKESGIETDMKKVEMTLVELRLHSVLSIASKSNISYSSCRNSGFFEKFPLYNKKNKQLSKRRFLTSLKGFIAVIKRKISASPSYTKIPPA